MISKKLFIVTICLGVLAGSIGCYIAFHQTWQMQYQKAEKKPSPAPPEEETVTVATQSKIQPSTKMIYQYYYPDDKVVEEQEDTPPYFLLDLTLTDMRKYYTDWQIVSFSSQEVVMRKIVQGKSNQRYIIGEKDGYVAVFYEQPQDGVVLHELTDTPLSALGEEEQQRLKDGIFVLGEDRLAKVLEDYGS